jgi:hypothetical protein
MDEFYKFTDDVDYLSRIFRVLEFDINHRNINKHNNSCYMFFDTDLFYKNNKDEYKSND